MCLSTTKLPNDGYPATSLDVPRSQSDLGGRASSPCRLVLAAPSDKSRSSRSTEELRATKVDREGRPSVPETRFSTILGRFGSRFSCFSRLLHASDSTRSANGRTSVFAGRRGTKQRFRIWRKNRKSTNIVEKLLRRACATQPCDKNSIFPISAANQRRN